MYCTKCGTEINDNSKFCKLCGAAQTATEANETNSVCQSDTGIKYSTLNTDWSNSFFDGGLLGLIGVKLVTFFISVLTLSIAYPALICYNLRWKYKHTVVGGCRLKFTGTGMQLFGKWITWVLLGLITLTIYWWWIPIKMKKWETKHIKIDSVIPAGELKQLATDSEDNKDGAFATAIKKTLDFKGTATKNEVRAAGVLFGFTVLLSLFFPPLTPLYLIVKYINILAFICCISAGVRRRNALGKPWYNPFKR